MFLYCTPVTREEELNIVYLKQMQQLLNSSLPITYISIGITSIKTSRLIGIAHCTEYVQFSLSIAQRYFCFCTYYILEKLDQLQLENTLEFIGKLSSSRCKTVQLHFDTKIQYKYKITIHISSSLYPFTTLESKTTNIFIILSLFI